MLTKKHIIKYKSRLLRKSWLLLLGFILFFGVANAGSIDVHKEKGNAENNTLPVEYALLGTDYAVTAFVTYANSASEVQPVIRKYSSYFGIVYTMGRIGGSLYSSAKLATAEEAAFAESAAKASTSEITTEETATATTVTSTEEKVTATSTEETAPTTPAKETTASEGTTTGTTTKENVPVETKTTEINDGSVAKGADEITQLTNKLVARGISSSIADDIALRAMYIDDAIGAKKMTSLLDEIASSPKFKNPEDLVDNLKSVFSESNVNSTNAKNLLKEFEEGKYWINQGEEVYISKKWSGNVDEVDVTITTKSTLVECKNVSGDKFKSVEDNLNAIVDKYTIEGKLSTTIKNQYPNHYGKISISSTNSPFYNSTKADFISKIKSGDIANGQMSIIGNGTNQIPLTDLKKITELHIENSQGRFVIKNTDW